ncbi:aminopeptidase N-like isoform X2 [Periplaneta americana]|uniref:aminopeptidase N-like isoform X2 n=1 Tax=Periplaneta americana TaxID=6978 RepID=UPI0037E7AD59
MLRTMWLLLLLLAAAVLGSPAGKVLHAKGSQHHDDKHASGRSMTRRSVDMTDAKVHIDDSRLPRDVVPTGYHLELHPFPSEGHFKGRVRINVTCREPTNTITLHAHEQLHIAHSEVTVKHLNARADYPFNHKGSSSVLPVTVASTKKEPSKQWYVVTLAENLKKDANYQLDLAFTGSLSSDSTQGFFRASYQLHRTKEERWFAAAKMSPSNARRVLPCFDEPDLKAPFKISIAIAKRMTALSNMPTSSTEEMANMTSWSWVHFQETPPMSTFSLAIAVLDLESTSLPTTTGGVRMSVYARPSFMSQVQEVLSKAVPIMETIQEYLTEPFPLPKMDIVALPKYADPEPADHWGLIILRESDFINDEILSWRLADEVVQQWLGHLTTPAWWGADARTNKALANFLATMAAQQSWNLVTGYTLFYEYSRRHPHAGSGSQEEYTKITRTQWLFRMLNYSLSGGSFKDGLRHFLQDKKFKTFTEDDIWDALTHQAHEDVTLEESITVQQIAKSWLSRERFPVVTVTRDYHDNSASVEQHVFLKERPQDMQERDSLLWWVPLMYLTQDNLDSGAPHEPVVWMKEEKLASLSNLPGPESFIVVNPDEIGMFMVNYDQQNWGLLLEYLQSPDQQMPTATRAKLLHDAWNLAYGGELNIATALNMTLFLEHEQKLPVWEVTFTMISHLGRRVSGTAAGLKFEDYTRCILTRLYNTLGEPQPEECPKKTKLRSLTHFYLCQLGYQPCVKEARASYSRWMQSEDPDAGNPVPESAICTVFQWGTMEEWEFGLQRLVQLPASRKQSERHYLLKTLASCPRQEEKVERILNITLLEGNDNFTEADARLVLSMMSGSANGYTTLLNFLSRNWDDLKQRFGSRPRMWEYMVHSATEFFKTLEGYNLVSELYVTRQGEFGTAEQIVEQALRTINAEAQWSDATLPVMEAWLDSHIPCDVA